MHIAILSLKPSENTRWSDCFCKIKPARNEICWKSSEIRGRFYCTTISCLSLVILSRKFFNINLILICWMLCAFPSQFLKAWNCTSSQRFGSSIPPALKLLMSFSRVSLMIDSRLECWFLRLLLICVFRLICSSSASKRWKYLQSKNYSITYCDMFS